MKRMVLFSVGLFFMCSIASAGERETMKRYFDYYVGEWEVTQSGSDQKGSLVITNAESGNAHHVVYSFGEMTNVSIWGYDPATKKWVGRGFNSSGGYVESTAKMPSSGGATARPGDAIRFSTMTFSDEGKVAAAWTDTIESHNRYEMKNTASGDFMLTRKE